MAYEAGYKAFNGYVFTAGDARFYNNVLNDMQATDDQKHRAFVNIISGKFNQ